MRLSALPASLDGLRLRAELAAATREGWEQAAARQAGIGRLKKFIAAGRAHAASKLAGKGGGLEAARALSGVMNAAVRALFDSVASDFDEAGATAPGLAVCALGGWGAGELAPQSDIDLLFLTGTPPREGAEAIVERMLYVLWDCGLNIGGGAIRTVDEALALVADDVSERTALLDLRWVSGDERLVSTLRLKFGRAHRTRESITPFIAAKLSERDTRVDRQGDSRYAVEPNIKDGKGALRDLQTLRWLAQVLYGNDAMERWVASGLLTVQDVERYLRAEDFYWAVRFHLHTLNGRKDDRLTFDTQPEISALMGYADSEDTLGVEDFMRDYFKRAIDVGALTRLVCAKLEADELKDPPSGIGRFMPADGVQKGDNALEEAGFVVRSGRLAFADPSRVEEDPVLMLTLFELAAARHLDLHPDAVALVSRSLRLVDDSLRRDERAARSFFAILLESDDPRITLRAMTEAGLLGAYIPEFGDIVARTQFNMYHRFTVDEHTLNALGLLREIEQGKLVADHPLATRIFPEITHRRALHLAVLLHDTGKGNGDQCIEGAERARSACERLGIEEAETELVAWLIANHLEMSDAAQRRDLSDPRTVLDFAGRVANMERLRLLTVLTVVDIRAVGPGVWNGWKAQLIRDLYEATAAVLAGGERADEEEARARLHGRADRARTLFRKEMERIDPEFGRRWIASLDDSYWLSFAESDRLRHAAFVRAAESRGGEVACGVRVDRRRSAAEVLILAPDRDGLFADIAGALALAGANVVGAQVATTTWGAAFDVFYVQEQGGKPYGWSDLSALDRLRASVEKAARGGLGGEILIPARRVARREAAFTVSPYVKLEGQAADGALVIEASGRDRPGLLHDLARAITDLGCSIQAARIDGYGERAVDVFYVTEQGRKISDPEKEKALASALMTVLGSGEAGASGAPSRLRAEASAGR
ncbi:UTP-GlnB uridylyltransferase, GlnD [Glycocaulis alkaliphilus]|uniref:Bifunctional uridylyltransferase/uridylyl-removing enzyme n=1 Tax=Glycocaulis alkaliphilus TaxID=1434191 RepID=A0A3T0E605_9PROT|nr:[protein-PII] uridylyltransferase [Glycocaulis alkaliphilus]AZU02656.1 UTP-GlnB uridylyltransferase, GlnD [Glycocaulis alkaliphilus]GGB79971.1 bifunctional uridylyltransferase/uridylyl-removing enzyme [Glycocaulis alkaliphilus]